jgi:hypothetical protein
VKNHVRLDYLFEAGLFDFDAVGVRREIREIVFARAVSRRLVTGVRAGADGDDFGVND